MNPVASARDTHDDIRFVAALNVETGRFELHEIAALDVAAQRIARLFGLVHVVDVESPDRGFYIPSSALLRDQADALRIHDESHLWGGVIPHAFVGTKLVSHPLFCAEAARPEGWKAVADIQSWTLPGYSVFSREDARAAGGALLARGSIRLKAAHARGGNGQTTLDDLAALDRCLDDFDSEELAQGLVIEQELTDTTTYSIGSSNLRGRRIAYWGVQRVVRDRAGAEVYGGSRLDIRRGDLDQLEATVADAELSHAIGLAREYDRAVCTTYDVVASRRNYDVIAGTDRDGVRRLGVLEQSWRFGGASMAELLAVERFEQYPDTDVLVAETVESYDDMPIPEEALMHWAGDRRSPRKFARIVSHGH